MIGLLHFMNTMRTIPPMKGKSTHNKKAERSFNLRSVALPKDVDARLQEWCNQNERSLSFAIAKAVREFLERQGK